MRLPCLRPHCQPSLPPQGNRKPRGPEGGAAPSQSLPPSPPLDHGARAAQAGGHLSRVPVGRQLPSPPGPGTAGAVSWEFPLPLWFLSIHTGVCDSEAWAEPIQIFIALLLAGAALWLEKGWGGEESA